MIFNQRLQLTVIILLIIFAGGIIASLSSGNLQLKWTGKAIAEEVQYSDVLKINKNSLIEINNLYSSSNHEFSACLNIEPEYTYYDNNSRLLARFVITGVNNISFSGGDNYAEHGYCKDGLIHSHPEQNCFFSLPDLYAIKDRFANGELFSVVICGKDHFIFITRNDLRERRIRT